jgi:uncharacterized lipoprotein NlpE involved in copper resistance
MKKKIIILSLLFLVLLGCENSKEQEVLCGIWNQGKITNDKFAYTIPDYEKHYKVNDGYIVIERSQKYKGVIYDLSENLFITEINGKYPTLSLSVKASYMGFENNVQVEKWRYGKIVVHFKDNNTIWFENELSEELNHLLKIRHFSLKFGPEKIFYKAEQVEKPIPKNKGELE